MTDLYKFLTILGVGVAVGGLMFESVFMTVIGFIIVLCSMW